MFVLILLNQTKWNSGEIG